jgi:hypothetical protein
MADFLQSSVLPGEAIPNHEHRRMLIALTIIIILAVLGVLGYLWKSSTDSIKLVPNNDNTNTALSTDPDLERLKKGIVNISEQEKIDSAMDLKAQIIPLTEKQKADLLLEK